MKASHLIITGVVGLSLGALVGTPQRHTDSAAPSPAARPQPAVHGGTHSKPSFAFPSDEARIVRLFSALQEPLELKKRFELFEALGELTAQDFPALVKHVEGLAPIPRNQLLVALIPRWFEVDFEAAQSWMLRHPKEFSFTDEWGAANPEAALQVALAMKGDSRATGLLLAAISKLAGEDPAAQAAWLKKLPQSNVGARAFSVVISALASKDPAAAYAYLTEIAPGPEQDDVRNGVLVIWAGSDPVGALAQVDQLLPTLKAGVLGNELITQLADRIGRKEPRLVLEWLTTLPMEFRTAPAIAAARGWARKEPVAALDWCVENEVDVARAHRDDFYMSQVGVLGEALANHPAATIEWLEARSSGPERDRLMERALGDSLWRMPKEHLFSEGSGYAMRLFQQLPADSQTRTAAAVGEKRAEQGDLTDLSLWAQNFPPGPARADAVAGAMRGTYLRDASRVEALLASVTSEADRDAALRGLADSMRNTAPAAAALRAVAISDTAIRRETLDSVMVEWLKQDPERARAWLTEEDEIPEPWKQAWRKTGE